MGKTKKILGIILAAAMLICMLPLTVFGAQIVDQGICGDNDLGDEGYNVKWVFTDDGTLHLTGSGETFDWRAISAPPWYDYKSEIKKVIIDAEITWITPGSFSGCSMLTEIVTDENNSNYNSINGILYNKEKTILCCYPNGKTDENFVVPASVDTIEYYAFKECVYLSKVSFENDETIKRIEDYAFADCGKLKSFELPNGNEEIVFCQFVFWNCTNLETVVLPEKYSSIEHRLFSGCESIRTIIVPNSWDGIGMLEFCDCANLTTIIIPDGVTYIGDGAFYGCAGLTDIYYTGTEEQWKQIEIRENGNDELLKATIHYNYKPVCEHDYTAVTTPATCAKDGKTVYTCSKCGDTYTETIAKKGHTPVTVPAVAATYEKTGLTEGTKCSVCGAVIKEQTVVPKLTAKFVESEKVKLDADRNVVAKAGITQGELKKAAANGKILGLDGKELAKDKAVGSGMTVVMPDGTKYTVIVPGDGDSDGAITAADARLALRQSVGLEKNTPQWFTKACNADGEKGVTAADARLILRVSVGLEKI